MYLLRKSKIYYFILLKKYWIRLVKLENCLMVQWLKIPLLHCRVSGSSPTQWTKTLEAASCGQKRKKKKLVSLILQFKLDGVMKHPLALTSLSERSIPLSNT